MREFAFQLLPDSRFVRHIAFTAKENVLTWMKERLPHSAYYSVALYQIPGAPSMSEKGFLGAELLFDIDVDHMKECRERMVRLCDQPDSPPLVPEDCLRMGLEKAFILKERLQHEFGISHVDVQFSGNRGFHVIAREDELLKLNNDERREILDYVMGAGLDLNLLFPRKRGYTRVPPSIEEPGWRGFLARFFYRNFSGEDPGIFFSRLEELVGTALTPADPQVTGDTSRLIRIPGSVNGKSGLTVARIPSVEKFSLQKYVPLEEPLIVRMLCDANDLFYPRRKYKRNIVYRVEPLIGVILVFRGAAQLLDLGV